MLLKFRRRSVVRHFPRIVIRIPVLEFDVTVDRTMKASVIDAIPIGKSRLAHPEMEEGYRPGPSGS